MFIYVYLFVYIYIYIYIYICIHVYMYVYIYIYVLIYVYIFIYVYMCYILIIITTQRRRKMSEGFFNKYVYLSLYCKGSKRVTRGLRVRGSWRPNRNCNTLTPNLMAISVVSFLFSWCSTGSPEAQLPAGWWLSLQHLISNFSGPQLNWRSRAPLAWCSFPYHISSITPYDL